MMMLLLEQIGELMKKLATKTLAIILAVAMTFALVACGGDNAQESTPESTPETTSEADVIHESEPESDEAGTVLPKRGIVTYNVYNSEYLDIRISLPSELNISIYSEEVVRQWNDNVEADFLEEVPESFWVAQDRFIEFRADWRHNMASGISVNFIKLDGEQKNWDEIEYIDWLISQMDSDDVERKTTPIQIGDNEWHSLITRIGFSDANNNVIFNQSLTLVNVYGGFVRQIRYFSEFYLRDIPDGLDDFDEIQSLIFEHDDFIELDTDEVLSWIGPYDPVIGPEVIKDIDRLITRGRVIGRSYDSEYLGLGFFIPHPWVFEPDESRPLHRALIESGELSGLDFEELMRLTSYGVIPGKVWDMVPYFEEYYALVPSLESISISIEDLAQIDCHDIYDFLQIMQSYGFEKLSDDRIELGNGNFHWYSLRNESYRGSNIALVTEDAERGVAIVIFIYTETSRADEIISWFYPYP